MRLSKNVKAVFAMLGLQPGDEFRFEGRGPLTIDEEDLVVYEVYGATVSEASGLHLGELLRKPKKIKKIKQEDTE